MPTLFHLWKSRCIPLKWPLKFAVLLMPPIVSNWTLLFTAYKECLFSRYQHRCRILNPPNFKSNLCYSMKGATCAKLFKMRVYILWLRHRQGLNQHLHGGCEIHFILTSYSNHVTASASRDYSCNRLALYFLWLAFSTISPLKKFQTKTDPSRL